MTTNPLDAIMDWYRTSHDAFRVSRRVVTQEIGGAVTHKHVFFDEPVPSSVAKLQAAKREFDRVVVLTLVAVFERTLRARILEMLAGALPNRNPFETALRERLASNVELWRFGDQLVDAFVDVSEEERGNVKQLIRFRDWFAHGHFVNQPAPFNAEPRMAYDRLSRFLAAADVID